MKNKQKTTIERLILFADIMGFKDRVIRMEPEVLKKDLLEFKTQWCSRMKPLQKGNHLSYSQFSDSIIIATDGAGTQQANLISKAGIILMQECLRKGFPLKGAIAQGQFTYDEKKQLFFGKPLVDAYLLQESIKYYGIVLHHTAEQLITRSSGAQKHYEKLKVFMENGRSSHFQLCWQKVDLALNDKNKCPWELWLETIEAQVSGRPRIYIDNTRTILEESQNKNKSNFSQKRPQYNYDYNK